MVAMQDTSAAHFVQCRFMRWRLFQRLLRRMSNSPCLWKSCMPLCARSGKSSSRSLSRRRMEHMLMLLLQPKSAKVRYTIRQPWFTILCTLHALSLWLHLTCLYCALQYQMASRLPLLYIRTRITCVDCACTVPHIDDAPKKRCLSLQHVKSRTKGKIDYSTRVVPNFVVLLCTTVEVLLGVFCDCTYMYLVNGNAPHIYDSGYKTSMRCAGCSGCERKTARARQGLSAVSAAVRDAQQQQRFGSTDSWQQERVACSGSTFKARACVRLGHGLYIEAIR